MERLGFGIFLTLIFVRYSRIIEEYWWLHIPRYLLLLAVVLAFSNGRFFRGFYHRLGGLLLGLTALFTFSVPFSVWPSGSLEFLTDQWYRSALMFFLTAAYATSWKRIRAVIITFGLALGYVGAIAIISGRTYTERVTGADHTFGNSNDFAMVMLFAIPLCIYMAVEKRLPLIVRFLGLIGAPAMAFPMSQTGSRMMLLVSCIMMVFLIFKAKPAQRLGIAAGALAVGMAAVIAMPTTALMRLGTIFDASAMTGQRDPVNDPSGGQVDAELLDSAVNSSYQRLHLLQRTITLSLSNPLFGVGIGQFAVAEHDLSTEEGRRKGSWQVAHNAFMEIASENGIPALIVFLMFLWTLWKTLTRLETVRRDEHPRHAEWWRLAVAMKGSLLSYLCCSLFLSIGYQDFIPVFAAVAAAGEFVLRRDMIILERQREGVELPEPEPQPAYAGGYGYGPEAVGYSTTDALAEGD